MNLTVYGTNSLTLKNSLLTIPIPSEIYLKDKMDHSRLVLLNIGLDLLNIDIITSKLISTLPPKYIHKYTHYKISILHYLSR